PVDPQSRARVERAPVDREGAEGVSRPGVWTTGRSGAPWHPLVDARIQDQAPGNKQAPVPSVGLTSRHRRVSRTSGASRTPMVRKFANHRKRSAVPSRKRSEKHRARRYASWCCHGRGGKPMATNDDGLSTFLSLRARLFGIAYRMLGSAAAAEDVVQD